MISRLDLHCNNRRCGVLDRKKPDSSHGQAGSSSIDSWRADLQLVERVVAYLTARSSRQCASADQSAAWEQFYTFYGTLVERLVQGWCPSSQDRADCVQEVWQEIITRLPAFHYDPARGPLCCFLATVVRRKIRAYTRRWGCHRPVQFAEGKGATLPCPGLGPSVKCEHREDRWRIRRAFHQLRSCLSPLSWRVFYLRWRRHHSFAEIGRALRLTPNQVRYHHAQAKERLQELMVDRVRHLA